MRYVATILRRGRRSTNSERTIFYHPRRRRERRHPRGLLRIILLLRRVATVTCNYSLRFVFCTNYGAGAAKQTAARDPDRNADRQQQSRRFH